MERLISPQNVHDLEVDWVFDSAGDVSATIIASEDKIYFPDWAGWIYCLHKGNKTLVHIHKTQLSLSKKKKSAENLPSMKYSGLEEERRAS